jgi:hypothetical protein
MKVTDRASHLPGPWLALRTWHQDWLVGCRLSLVLLAAVISVGCPFSTPEPVLVREPRPEPIPLRIGVYYSPEFRSFTYRHHFSDTARILGEPSVKLIHQALAMLFDEIVEAPGLEREPVTAATSTGLSSLGSFPPKPCIGRKSIERRVLSLNPFILHTGSSSTRPAERPWRLGRSPDGGRNPT